MGTATGGKESGQADQARVPPLLILAGGFGTRLRKAVADVPKPLAPVEDKNFLYFLLQSYYRQGVRDFIFSLHFGGEKISEWLRVAGLPNDTRIRTVVEPQALGTG